MNPYESPTTESTNAEGRSRARPYALYAAALFVIACPILQLAMMYVGQFPDRLRNETWVFFGVSTVLGLLALRFVWVQFLAGCGTLLIAACGFAVFTAIAATKFNFRLVILFLIVCGYTFATFVFFAPAYRYLRGRIRRR